MDRIIITGGSGFIGSNLFQYYLDQGFTLLNIDLNPPKSDLLKKYWKKIDITSFEEFEKAVLDFSPDYIIHLAARTDLDGKTIDDYSANTIGTENLLEICKKLPALKRVLFTSSMLVCTPGYIPKHSSDYSPATVYGESKVNMEKMIKNETLDCEWAIVRPTSIWGPGFGIPYRNFFDMVIKHAYFHIGNRGCTKTYGYIGNVIYQIDTILNAPKKDIQEQIFYLGDYKATNIRIWADEIAKQLEYKIKTVPFFIIKGAAIFGDILKLGGISFPMSSFRLKNMTTDNVVDLSNTQQVAPNLPFDRIEGIKQTLNWLNTPQ